MTTTILPDWYLAARRVPGMSGRMWALLDHLADLPEDERAPHTQAFIRRGAKFSITGDSFAVVDFVDRRGAPHMGAFWGDWDETVRNVYAFIDHMNANGGPAGWSTDHAAALSRALSDAVGVDYRARR